MSQAVSKITDHEDYWRKHADADFENVWRKLSHMEFKGLKESYRHAYDAGRASEQFLNAAKKEKEGKA